VVRQGKLVVGAQAGSVTLLVANGTQFEILADDSLSDDRRSGRSRVAGAGATKAVETRQPVFVGSFAEWQRDWAIGPRRPTACESTVALPLLAKASRSACSASISPRQLNFDEYGRC
jgi:hypothetical protein